MGRVLTARDGVRALALLERDPEVHVILMDLMPNREALDTLRILRTTEMWQSLPVIILIASTGSVDEADALQAGANAVLAKPIRTDALIDTLSRWLSPASRAHS
ncbi:MAG: response regulator [Magnetococcales bacterium]|nr:response regulator [Magnetococcales bacterium]